MPLSSAKRVRPINPVYNAIMPLTCNIDARGKAARLIYGICLVAIGLAIAWFIAWGTSAFWPWFTVISCLIAGGIGIFEGWAGWCMMRAMGFKTPI